MEIRYNRYRIKTKGKWSGWRKCDMTEKELSEMVAHPKIESVEWKNPYCPTTNGQHRHNLEGKKEKEE